MPTFFLTRPLRTALLLVLPIALLSGCATTRPGAVATSSDDQLVSIGAGDISNGYGAYLGARYVLDKRTQLCWFTYAAGIAPMSCCDLRRVPEAQPVLTWLTDAQCTQAGAPPAPKP